MNNEPKNLTELVAAFREKMSTATALDKKADTARIEAGKLMLECRSRVVAGEAGDHYKTHFWLWFDANVKGRSRNDAAKVMALASAPDPMAALEEERRKAREGMAATRQRRSSNVREMSAEEIEREARVNAYIEKRERERIERGLQSYDRQVKDYLLAIKSFDQATAVALTALRKFSPEARAFTKRKLKAALDHADELITALSEIDQRHHVSGANGKAAA